MVPAAPITPVVPQLSDAQILELVHGKVAELIGENGEWTVSRRSADDTDALFHSVLAQSVSLDIATAIADARRRLEAGEAAAAPQHLAEPEADVPAPVAPEAAEEPAEQVAIARTPAEPAAEAEPAAPAWEPAPITVWTDLRKPVTGEIPALPQRPAA